MAGSGSQLDLGQFLGALNKVSPYLGNVLQKIQDAVNNLGTNLAGSPVGKIDPPSQIQKLDVKVSGETVHVSHTDNNPLAKGIHYFTEIDTDPSFPRPLVIHHGTSRTSHPFNLPAKDDNGVAVTYFMRGYNQLPGSDPSLHVNFGGDQPTAVTMTGTTQMTLLPSNGSGTAAADGTQGGHGFGKVLERPAIGPKRANMQQL